MGVWVASLTVGATLVAAGAAKAADRHGAVVALSTYGAAGRTATTLWGGLVMAELVIGGLLLAGVSTGAWAATGLLGAFLAGQLLAIAAGRGGAPCGCLGGEGRLGAWSVARTAALTGVAVVAVVAWEAAPAWSGAVVAVAAAAAGTLWRRRPAGALDVAGEGPPVGERTALADHVPAGGLRLAVFTSEGCALCRRIKPALARLGDGVDVHVLDEERDAAAWLAARVPGSPYAVVLDPAGVVLAKGTVNTRGQLRSLLAEAAPQRADDPARRGFLRLGAGVAGAATVSRLVRPGQAEAYHFCGHIYTTDSCPHPTGLPRIDSRGLPLRARDGHRVDDLGRLIDADGRPVDEDGALLLDDDGFPLPPATRTSVCTATGREYRIRVRVDGAWYRCCGGSVRKLVDCCSTHPRRINGDRSLKGYCYANRKVFCVMYYQTKVPC